jgi:hypothetical protein
VPGSKQPATNNLVLEDILSHISARLRVVAGGVCHGSTFGFLTYQQFPSDEEKEVMIDKDLNGHGTFHGLM